MVGHRGCSPLPFPADRQSRLHPGTSPHPAPASRRGPRQPDREDQTDARYAPRLDARHPHRSPHRRSQCRRLPSHPSGPPRPSRSRPPHLVTRAPHRVHTARRTSVSSILPRYEETLGMPIFLGVFSRGGVGLGLYRALYRPAQPCPCPLKTVAAIDDSDSRNVRFRPTSGSRAAAVRGVLGTA